MQLFPLMNTGEWFYGNWIITTVNEFWDKNQKVPLVPLNERWVLGIFLWMNQRRNKWGQKKKIRVLLGRLEMNRSGWRESLPVRPRDNLVMMAPVMANPTRNGQFRFHSRLKKTGHGSNFLISDFSRWFQIPLFLSLCLRLWVGCVASLAICSHF